MDGTETIKVELQYALAILEKLESMGRLDIKLSLLSSPRFTPDTRFDSRNYCNAAEDASSII